MTTSKIIKHLLVERNVTVKELAEKLGLSSPQIFSTKLYRNSFSHEEMVKIADILEYDVKLIDRKTGKEPWDSSFGEIE